MIHPAYVQILARVRTVSWWPGPGARVRTVSWWLGPGARDRTSPTNFLGPMSHRRGGSVPRASSHPSPLRLSHGFPPLGGTVGGTGGWYGGWYGCHTVSPLTQASFTCDNNIFTLCDLHVVDSRLDVDAPGRGVRARCRRASPWRACSRPFFFCFFLGGDVYLTLIASCNPVVCPIHVIRSMTWRPTRCPPTSAVLYATSTLFVYIGGPHLFLGQRLLIPAHAVTPASA